MLRLMAAVHIDDSGWSTMLDATTLKLFRVVQKNVTKSCVDDPWSIKGFAAELCIMICVIPFISL